jgi:hypothetical protein
LAMCVLLAVLASPSCVMKSDGMKFGRRNFTSHPARRAKPNSNYRVEL